jgi:hypothetical protein
MRTFTGLAAVVALVFAAGCGGGSSASGPTAKDPSG